MSEPRDHYLRTSQPFQLVVDRLVAVNRRIYAARRDSNHAARWPFCVAIVRNGSQWRRQGEGGKLSPYGWTSKNYVLYVCAFIVMGLLRITQQIHCKAAEQRATLIHRQYNRDWRTSYSRPPIDPYITFPLLQNPGGATGGSLYFTIHREKRTLS